jgi:hypothetical protein
MDQMLDAGFWILDFKRKLSLFIQHQVSSIQYLANCGINDRFHDVVIFGSGLSGLCVSGTTSKNNSVSKYSRYPDQDVDLR